MQLRSLISIVFKSPGCQRKYSSVAQNETGTSQEVMNHGDIND